MLELELDVRPLRKPDKHPTIFATYADLGVGESFVLVNNHDPRHLHEEFETEHPGGFHWTYLDAGPHTWRIRITKLTASRLPHILGNTQTVADQSPADAAGALWKLQMSDRDLDANVVQLPPGGGVGAHRGPETDVLIHILGGGGQLLGERGTVELSAGDLVWLPRRSQRQLTAGSDGLRYLTVHRRRHALTLDTSSWRESADQTR